MSAERIKTTIDISFSEALKHDLYDSTGGSMHGELPRTITIIDSEEDCFGSMWYFAKTRIAKKTVIVWARGDKDDWTIHAGRTRAAQNA